MTFFEARAISQTNLLHIRRSSWTADKWFMPWRGTWFVFATGLSAPIPVRALDYSADDLNATDWTTVPAPLTSCPITPTEPTGGGPPTPGYPGFPTGTPPGFPPTPGGGGGGGGSPSGSGPSLPPADPGTSIRVLISGLTHGNDPDNTCREIDDLDDTYTLESTGPGTWQKQFPHGEFFPIGSSTPDHGFEWTINVTSDDDGTGRLLYAVNMFSVALPPPGANATGGFTPINPAYRKAPMNNLLTASYGFVIYGGFAKIL